jgi:alkaline phosphatase
MNPQLPISPIADCVQTLANAHEFDLIPGKALVVAGKGHTNNLVIAIFDHEHRYMLSRTIPRNNAEVPGFRVYYTSEWQPIQAADDENRPLNDLEGADARMSSFVAAFCSPPDPENGTV